MRGRLLAINAIIVITMLLIAGGLYANQSIALHIDGKKVESEVTPQLIQDRLLVPIRVISEHLGANVQWNQESATVEITSPSKKFLDSYTEKGMYIRQAADVMALQKHNKVVILDVRSPNLRNEGHIAGSIHILMPQLSDRMNELPDDKAIAVYCAKNINASYAVAILNMHGYEAYLLEGGLDAWLAEDGPAVWPCPTRT